MQIRNRIRTSRPESEFDKSLEPELMSYTLELAKVINKGLKFTDNFNAEILTIADSGAAGSENTVGHGLKRVPTGFIVTSINKAGIVYLGASAWTSTNIYLKCNAANCAITILVF
jgi:hypothetical protein